MLPAQRSASTTGRTSVAIQAPRSKLGKLRRGSSSANWTMIHCECIIHGGHTLKEYLLKSVSGVSQSLADCRINTVKHSRGSVSAFLVINAALMAPVESLEAKRRQKARSSCIQRLHSSY
ncbi:hypothetical protein ECG_09875 [Echinococcus granulosus]|nr:hypothetical protein ECG_09875 [Echinococcus granulosus]